MDYSKVKKALEAAEEKARELGTAVSTAIVDEHGFLVAFSRMEGALPISAKFSLSKADAAATLGMPTADVAKYATEGKPYFGINTLFGGEFAVMAGGVPIKDGNKLIGGIGVGGSFDVRQDAECAEAALAELQ